MHGPATKPMALAVGALHFVDGDLERVLLGAGGLNGLAPFALEGCEFGICGACAGQRGGDARCGRGAGVKGVAGLFAGRGVSGTESTIRRAFEEMSLM